MWCMVDSSGIEQLQRGMGHLQRRLVRAGSSRVAEAVSAGAVRWGNRSTASDIDVMVIGDLSHLREIKTVQLRRRRAYSGSDIGYE